MKPIRALPIDLDSIRATRDRMRQEAIDRYGWPETISCHGCGDTGIVPDDDPRTIRYCFCEAGRERAELAAREQGWATLMPVRVRGFRLDTAPDQQAARYVREWLATEPWATGANLLVNGPPGTGKTGLAVGALHVVHMTGRRVAMVNVVDWLDLMRPTDDKGQQAEAQRVQSVAERCSLLLLDDLGADKPSEWVRTRVYQIVNHRYENRRPILLTTNCTRQELNDMYGQRVIDRLMEPPSTGYTMRGANLRRSSHAG